MATTNVTCNSFKDELITGIHYVAKAWAASTAYVVGDRRTNDSGKVYECITAGTSAGSGGPTGTTSDITDNTAHWKYLWAQDVFKVALYNSSATLSKSTTAYSSTNEISGTGYSAGGGTLTGINVNLAGANSDVASIDWADYVFSNSTLTSVTQALIYNSSKQNRAVCVVTWDSPGKSTNAGDFTVQLPSSGTGVIRIS